MGQNLDNELIATVEGKLGVAAPANTSGRSSDTAEIQVRSMTPYGASACSGGCATYMRVPGSSVVP
jgi:hypothetical protein